MKRIIVSVINDLVTDQRVHKVAQLLYDEGNDVLLIGRKLPQSLGIQRDYKVMRMKLILNKGPLFYITFNVRLFFILLFKKADIFVANDLDTLLANYLVSQLRNKPLVYDTHEIFTEMPELQNRNGVKWIWQRIEKYIVPKLKKVYTVNHSIANYYSEKYGVSVGIVRNIPPDIKKEKWPVREDLSLPVGKRIIILQGAGININRGAEEAILAMKYLNNILLLIIGGGEVFEQLKILVLEENLSDKVTFLPKMPYDELMVYTHIANIGLSLDKDTNINYRYSLPNKIFDYIQAQIPVLCTNLVEVANIVNTWEIGLVIDDLQPENLALIISNMLENEEMNKIWKQNLKKAAQELNWNNEKGNLLTIYSELLR